MILSLLAAFAQEPAPDVLTPHRLDFNTLSDRAIGTTSVPVAYDWRRSTVQIAVVGAQLYELNAFNSLRGGLQVRVPSNNLLLEAGVHGVSTWDSAASEVLALTPFRQPGRPSRMEIDIAVSHVLAEGVVTAIPRWFPGVQLVFSATASFRYSLYPTAFRGLRRGQVATAIFNPSLSDDEVDNLDRARLDAMAVDRGRYTVLLGISNDIYFKQGLFVTPRFLFSLPILAPVTGTDLYFWGEVSLAVGLAL